MPVAVGDHLGLVAEATHHQELVGAEVPFRELVEAGAPLVDPQVLVVEEVPSVGQKLGQVPGSAWGLRQRLRPQDRPRAA